MVSRSAPGCDVFGAALLRCFKANVARGIAYEVVERDDGHISVVDMSMYFDPNMSAVDRALLAAAHGRILDIGAGAGRHALALQNQPDVTSITAIDASPGAVEVARQRGVDDVRQMRIADLRPDLGRFDTLLLAGNNLGLLGSDLRDGLRRLSTLLDPGGTILAATLDYTRFSSSYDTDYAAAQERSGRHPGEQRIRLRFQNLVGDWFSCPFFTPEQVAIASAAAGMKATVLVGPGDREPAWAVRIRL